MRRPYSLFIFILLTLSGCTGYTIENDGIFYTEVNEAQGSVKRHLKEADFKTFAVLENEDYGKDKKLVFYKGNRIKGADPATFSFIADLYAKDKYRAYYAGDSIELSTSSGFRIIDSYYSADDKDIFYTTKPLHVCNAKNFKIFENKEKQNLYERWATDGCYYYFTNFKIPSENYKDVQILKESAGFAKDKNYVYMLNRKLNFNEEGEKIIDTIDAATFTVTNYLDCKDKFGCINPYLGREECNR